MTKNDIKELLINLKEFLTMKVEIKGFLEEELPEETQNPGEVLSKSKLYTRFIWKSKN